MAGIEQAAVHAIHQFAVRAEMLHNQPQFGLIENVHHLMNARVDRFLKKIRVESRLNFQSHVAKNHRQGKTLHRTRALGRLVPTAFRVVYFREHDVERLAGKLLILLIARGKGELPESDDGKVVRKDVVRLYERTALAVEREIPVKIAVVPVLLEDGRVVLGCREPFGALLYFIL